MTRHQQRVIDRIKSLCHSEFFTCHKDAEFKKFEVNEYDTFVSVYAIVGGKNDEGTMASVLCRERIHLFVGKRGGITYPVYVMKKHKSVTRQFKNLYSVYYEQEYNV